MGRLHELLCDLLYPRRCAICDTVLRIGDEKSGICGECRKKLHYVRNPRCMKCGAPLGADEEEYCLSCAGHRHVYDRGLALYEYPFVRLALYRLKYNGRKEYARFFGRELARRFGPQLKQWGVQALVPVPMYAAKRRRRGFNQAEALAEVMGAAMGLPVEKKLLIRVRNTRPMKLLGEKERQINIKNAFLCTQDVVKLDRVVLVDDIYTTGATIDAAAAELKNAGVKNVFFVTLAVGTTL